MQTKEDLRVQKTKAALNEAFTQLVGEKSFEEISVNEICVKAGIRRATFYKHFTDKNHFLGEYIGFLRQRYDKNAVYNQKPGTSTEYYAEYAKRAIRFIYANDKIVNQALNSSILHIILGIIAERNYHDTCEKLKESVRAGMKLPASVEAVSAMLTGGVSTIICLWLFNGKYDNLEKLEKEIEILVSNVLKV